MDRIKSEANTQYAETVKPHSFEGRYGGTGTTFKIYFDDLNDLKKGIEAVITGKEFLKQKLQETEVTDGPK